MTSLVTGHLLVWMVLLPLGGAIMMASLPKRLSRLKLWLGAIATGLPIIIYGMLLTQFRGIGGLEFSNYLTWQVDWGPSFWVALDGLSIALVGMTVFLAPLFFFLAHKEAFCHRRLIFILLIEAFVLGVLVSLDLFLFFLFLESAGIAAYFLMGLEKNREGVRVATIYLIFNLLGGGAVLLSLCALSLNAGGSLNLATLLQSPLDKTAQLLWGSVFLLGLGLKVGFLPFHLWLRESYQRLAPSCALFLSALVFSLGLYAMLRFAFPLFPKAMVTIAPYGMAFGILSLVGGGLRALGAPSLLEKMAYVSLANFGLILFGLFLMTPDAIQGALYQLLSHGLMLGAVAILLVLGERQARPAQLHNDAGGRVLLFLVLLAAMGFPGMTTFVGFFMILLEGFRVVPILSSLAVLAWIMIAGALLQWFQHRMRDSFESASVAPVNLVRVHLILLPFIILLGIGGLMPQTLLERTHAAVTLTLDRLAAPDAPKTEPES